VNPQNMAMQAALGGGEGAAPGGAPGGGPQTPGPAFPPELAAVAQQLGLDINNPEHLMILMQMLGQGGGGPLGPMAGAGPNGGGQVPPQSY
jgi:hypothetical protein